jgi:chromate transport protein ChrA
MPRFGLNSASSLPELRSLCLGGSYTVIPYVAHLAVAKYHWLGHGQMIDGFALAKTTPGSIRIFSG